MERWQRGITESSADVIENNIRFRHWAAANTLVTEKKTFVGAQL